MNSYLIKRKSLLLAGIKQAEDNDEIISFDNMSIAIGSADPKHVVLMSREEVIALAEELKNVIGDAKYIQPYDNSPYAAPIPTSAELDALYAGAGIKVEEASTGNIIRIGSAAGNTPAVDGNSILFNDRATGLFEEGVFKGGSWIISNIKNTLPTILSDMQTRTVMLESDLKLLDEELHDVIDADSKYLTTDNDKDINPIADILIQASGPNDANRIATREKVRQLVASVEKDLAGSGRTKTITQLEAADESIQNRLSALETAEYLEDKIWNGSKVLADTNDLSTITDQHGNTFEFQDGKRLVIYVKHTGKNQGKSTEITVGDLAGVAISIPTGVQSDTIHLTFDNTGSLTAKVTNGNSVIGDYELYQVIENKGAKTVSAGYTKSESDAKYAPISVESTKQDKIDNSLSTTSKAVVGAINELKQSADLADRLGGLKTTDGDDLSTTTEEIVTKKTLNAQTGHASHASNSNFLGEFADVASLPTTAALGNYAFVGSGSTWLEYGYTDTDSDGTGDTWELIGTAASGGASSIDEKRLWRTGSDSLAAGEDAGKEGQGYGAVAIGHGAGSEYQGSNSVAIGNYAGETNSPDGSITIGYLIDGDEKGGIKIGSYDVPANILEVKGGKLYVGGHEITSGGSGGGSGGSGTAWKEIHVADLDGYAWTDDDNGKKVRITGDYKIYSGILIDATNKPQVNFGLNLNDTDAQYSNAVFKLWDGTKNTDYITEMNLDLTGASIDVYTDNERVKKFEIEDY